MLTYETIPPLHIHGLNVQICLREWSTIAETFTLTSGMVYKLSTLNWKLKKNLSIQLSSVKYSKKRYSKKGSILWKVTSLYESDLAAALIPHKTCPLNNHLYPQMVQAHWKYHTNGLSAHDILSLKNFTLLTANTLMYKKNLVPN
jgi:hypothetical protein